MSQLLNHSMHNLVQKRFQNDMSINNTTVEILQDQLWVPIPWRKLQVGDIVKVNLSYSNKMRCISLWLPFLFSVVCCSGLLEHMFSCLYLLHNCYSGRVQLPSVTYVYHCAAFLRDIQFNCVFFSFVNELIFIKHQLC